MKLSISLDMDNAAFDAGNDARGDYVEGFEAARILRQLATLLEEDKLRTGWVEHLRDFNGNRCGAATVQA